uniref:Wsv270-like protein n=1 Tax=Sicyonia whispovirus TaxID=2984283 RepID=A0A9C7C9E1_9VIRU|nr:MAG: wsv270-like protein [Sicyonia whispovirus]
MKKYFVVDCDYPVPSAWGAESAARPSNPCSASNMERLVRVASAATSAQPGDGKKLENVLVGVNPGGDTESCERCLKLVTHYVNALAGRRVFGSFALVKALTGEQEGSRCTPFELNGQLVFLSRRLETQSLRNNKNSWWNANRCLRENIARVKLRRTQWKRATGDRAWVRRGSLEGSESKSKSERKSESKSGSKSWSESKSGSENKSRSESKNGSRREREIGIGRENKSKSGSGRGSEGTGDRRGRKRRRNGDRGGGMDGGGTEHKRDPLPEHCLRCGAQGQGHQGDGRQQDTPLFH